MSVVAMADLRAKVGQEIGVSDWITIDQRTIDLFAEVTQDRQFIHVDPVAAAATPFGGTVAHGFLTLSLLSRMAADVALLPPDIRMAANYGMEAVRFISPVRAGRRVRGRFTLIGVEERKPGEWRLAKRATVEIEGEERPALIAEWIVLAFV